MRWSRLAYHVAFKFFLSTAGSSGKFWRWRFTISLRHRWLFYNLGSVFVLSKRDSWRFRRITLILWSVHFSLTSLSSIISAGLWFAVKRAIITLRRHSRCCLAISLSPSLSTAIPTSSLVSTTSFTLLSRCSSSRWWVDCFATFIRLFLIRH